MKGWVISGEGGSVTFQAHQTDVCSRRLHTKPTPAFQTGLRGTRRSGGFGSDVGARNSYSVPTSAPPDDVGVVVCDSARGSLEHWSGLVFKAKELEGVIETRHQDA